MPSVDEIKAKIAPEPKAEAAKPTEVAKVASGVKKPKKPAKLKSYSVGLVHNPTYVVEAIDRLDAIDVYKKRCGILATVHEFTVEAVDEDTDE